MGMASDCRDPDPKKRARNVTPLLQRRIQNSWPEDQRPIRQDEKRLRYSAGMSFPDLGSHGTIRFIYYLFIYYFLIYYVPVHSRIFLLLHSLSVASYLLACFLLFLVFVRSMRSDFCFPFRIFLVSISNRLCCSLSSFLLLLLFFCFTVVVYGHSDENS